jgi:DNA-binding protein HU-beta
MINRAVFTRALQKSAGLSSRDAELCVGLILDGMAEGISSGERVEIRGLGSFFIRKAAARKMSLNTREASLVPEHGRIVFRPALKLRKSAWNRT